MAKLQNLGRTGHEEIRRCLFDVTESSRDSLITGRQSRPYRIINQVIGHELGNSELGTSSVGAPSPDSRSVNSATPSIIAPFCLEAISLRRARSRTARFERSPVRIRALSMSPGSRSTLVIAMVHPFHYMVHYMLVGISCTCQDGAACYLGRVSQNATALAAATLRESTPWLMGMITWRSAW